MVAGKLLRNLCFLAAAVIASTRIVAAMDILSFDTDRVGQRYTATAVMRIHGDVERVFALLTDYPNWPQLNPAIITSEVVSRNGNRVRVRSLTRPCALMFCIDIEQVQQIEAFPAKTITAQTLPKFGNLLAGFVRWRLSPDRTATILRLDADFIPDFWIPPFVGPWLIDRTLRKEIMVSVKRLEQLAHTATLRSFSGAGHDNP